MEQTPKGLYCGTSRRSLSLTYFDWKSSKRNLDWMGVKNSWIKIKFYHQNCGK